jgi:hypothetical protein
MPEARVRVRREAWPDLPHRDLLGRMGEGAGS